MRSIINEGDFDIFPGMLQTMISNPVAMSDVYEKVLSPMFLVQMSVKTPATDN